MAEYEIDEVPVYEVQVGDEVLAHLGDGQVSYWNRVTKPVERADESGLHAGGWHLYVDHEPDVGPLWSKGSCIVRRPAPGGDAGGEAGMTSAQPASVSIPVSHPAGDVLAELRAWAAAEQKRQKVNPLPGAPAHSAGKAWAYGSVVERIDFLAASQAPSEPQREWVIEGNRDDGPRIIAMHGPMPDDGEYPPHGEVVRAIEDPAPAPSEESEPGDAEVERVARAIHAVRTDKDRAVPLYWGEAEKMARAAIAEVRKLAPAPVPDVGEGERVALLALGALKSALLSREAWSQDLNRFYGQATEAVRALAAVPASPPQGSDRDALARLIIDVNEVINDMGDLQDADDHSWKVVRGWRMDLIGAVEECDAPESATSKGGDDA